MSFFGDLLQGVPVNSVLRERMQLAEQKLETLDDEAQRLRDQVGALRIENADLKKQVGELQIEHNFLTLRGVLWKKEEDGHYLPYCPKCKLPFSTAPVHSPDFFICTVCKFEPPFAPREVPQIVAGIAKPSPAFRDYTHDTFFGLMWRWNYDAKGKIETIHCFCPKCDRELKSRNNDEWENDDFSLLCVEHGEVRNQISSINEFRDDATHEVELNIRNGNWKDRVASQNASLARH